ncbi:MAG: ATP-dependent sacrificial sulfur transferase LarE [Planctomycetota bacterium]
MLNDSATDALLEALVADVAACESAVVAFSGGVDSTVVLAIAARALGSRALGLMGESDSLAPAEAAAAQTLAAELGLELLVVPTAEQQDERYLANAPDRCFYCKTELYSVCQRVAAERGLRTILNGTNADDLADWRPGLRAAEQAAVHSPLLACGLGKPAVRAVARRLGLSNWDKPALACLASRLPHGTRVTPARLAAVDLVESRLRSAGFRQVRARHFGAEVLLEVEAERVPELQAMAGDTLLGFVRAAGFQRYTIATDGYRSGRLSAEALRSAGGSHATSTP